MKLCEKCNVEIPDDFGNNLCGQCYQKLVDEIEEAKKIQRAEQDKNNVNLKNTEIIQPLNSGITDPDYKCNPQKEDKEQVSANWGQFVHSGKWLWHHTRGMYEFIRDQFRQKVLDHPQYPQFIWKPSVCDVGCGSGCGSNILSQEADFVWGIDKNAFSIKFAKEVFERHKNSVYYSSQLTFDCIDIEKDPRELMTFDEIVAIEIIEHIADYEKTLQFIKKLCHKGGKRISRVWISTPNRNNDSIQKDHPKNSFHCFEWTSQEFYEVLKKHFKDIQFYNYKGGKVDFDTKETPLLAGCDNPIL